jgi:hypothetical protein
MKRPTETQLVRACLDYLKLRGVCAWRSNSGAMTAGDGPRKRFVRFSGARGCSDILGVAPGGRFLALEVKMPAGRLTADQEAFLAQIRAAGGVALVVRSVDELRQALDGLGGGA